MSYITRLARVDNMEMYRLVGEHAHSSEIEAKLMIQYPDNLQDLINFSAARTRAQL